jgi:hypothetical protein
LYFYRARYYDPQLMRFISEDPIGLAGGMNSYAYVKGNPHRYTDPFGLWTIQLGLSGTYTTPFGRAGAGFAGITFDSQGNVGTYWGGGLGFNPWGGYGEILEDCRSYFVDNFNDIVLSSNIFVLPLR